jgi:hypothetical protein
LYQKLPTLLETQHAGTTSKTFLPIYNSKILTKKELPNLHKCITLYLTPNPSTAFGFVLQAKIIVQVATTYICSGV